MVLAGVVMLAAASAGYVWSQDRSENRGRERPRDLGALDGAHPLPAASRRAVLHRLPPVASDPAESLAPPSRTRRAVFYSRPSGPTASAGAPQVGIGEDGWPIQRSQYTDGPPLSAADGSPTTTPQDGDRIANRYSTWSTTGADAVPGGQGNAAGGGGVAALNLNEVSVRTALEMFSRSHGLNIMIAPGVNGQITANLNGMPVQAALKAILKLCNLVAQYEGDLIYVYSPAEVPNADTQLRVFPLDYVAALDVMPAVTHLLSPAGHAFSTQVAPDNNRKTREALIVTDLPRVLERVGEYVTQIDVPPPQVMIEAHILQVNLSDDLRHGINYNHAMEMIGNGSLELGLTGFVDPTTSPTVFARLHHKKVDALLHFLKATTDAKTLASPRVMVVNGQTARIQVGEQIPYKVVTVTETTAIEEVRFLDVGVVLEVTPRISRDGHVMMRVKPEVSDGTFHSETKLPGEETRELESDVMLQDGQGMVIGGLIQEKDSVVQTKVPWLGDLHLVGRLFQRRDVIKLRSEVVITLVPRICTPGWGTHPDREEIDAERSQTRLFYGPLHRVPRPWEPVLPDAVNNPTYLQVPLLHGGCRSCGPGRCECQEPWQEGEPAPGPQPPPVPVEPLTPPPTPAAPASAAGDYPQPFRYTASPAHGWPPPVIVEPPQETAPERVAPAAATGWPAADSAAASASRAASAWETEQASAASHAAPLGTVMPATSIFPPPVMVSPPEAAVAPPPLIGPYADVAP